MDERAAFESWFRSKVGASHEDLRNRHEYGYASDEIQRQWRAWQARAALASSSSQPVGWKLVPVEPTFDMIRAGKPQVGQRPGVEVVWANMLAAAPALVEGKK